MNFYRDKIISKNIKTISFSVNCCNLFFSIELAKRIKEKDLDKIIIFGGPEYSIKRPIFGTPSYLSLIDIVVEGEGEEALDEIMRCIEAGRALDELPNAAICKEGLYRVFFKREVVENLDSLPFPNFDAFSLDKYTHRALPILMSKGCIGKCSFCDEPSIFKEYGYRYRSAKNLLKEVVFQIYKYKINKFAFADSMLNINLKELELFCTLIFKNNIKIKWACGFGIRKDMDQELFVKMKRAGCVEIHYGVESFSNKVLKAMDKRFTAEDALRTLEFTKIAGINAYINLIIGFPGEGEEEFNETIEFLTKAYKYIVSIVGYSLCIVRYGSDIQLHPSKYGIIYDSHIEEDVLKWHTLDGSNTYELRKKRFQRLSSFLSELNVHSFPPFFLDFLSNRPSLRS